MNSKTFHYNAKIEIAPAPGARIFSKIRNLLQALSQHRITNRYRLQQQRRHQGSSRDIVRAMPVEEKLRLGLYHLMD